MMTLGEAMGVPDEEAQSRFALRQALADFGRCWANDFDRVAAACDDQAANLPLTEQPRFAFLRGQAAVYRQLANEIRTMPAANAAVIKTLEQQGELQ